MTRTRRLGALLGGLAAAGALFVGGTAVGHADTDASSVSSSEPASDVVDVAFDTDTDGDSAAKQPRCTAVQRWTALAQEAPQIRDILTAHPDWAGELDHLRSLPRGQRRAEAKTYVQAHPDVRPVVQQLRDIRQQARASCTAGS